MAKLDLTKYGITGATTPLSLEEAANAVKEAMLEL